MRGVFSEKMGEILFCYGTGPSNDHSAADDPGRVEKEHEKRVILPVWNGVFKTCEFFKRGRVEFYSKKDPQRQQHCAQADQDDSSLQVMFSAFRIQLFRRCPRPFIFTVLIFSFHNGLI